MSDAAAPLMPIPHQEQGYEQLVLLVRLIGQPATVALIEKFGGQRITVSDAEGARVAAAIGDEAQAVLFGHFGRDRLQLPLAKCWRARLYRARGATYSEIGRRLGCNEQTVWKYLRAPPRPPRQSSLAL